MNIRDVMSTNVKTIRPSATLREAAALMDEGNTGFLLVGAEDELKGTLTDQDIVRRAIAKGWNPEGTTVKDVFTDRVLYCEADQEINQVARNMSEQKVRRLPVVDDNKRLVGIVSISDLARHISPETMGEILKQNYPAPIRAGLQQGCEGEHRQGPTNLAFLLAH